MQVDNINGVECRFKDDSDYYTRSSDFSSRYMPNDGEWNHVACVWDGVRLYSVLNEKIVGSSWYDGLQIEASTGNAYIGSGRGGMHRFEGLLDEISIYNYAKSLKNMIDMDR